MNENETLTVTLTLDNDEELECAVLTIFETEGRNISPFSLSTKTGTVTTARYTCTVLSTTAKTRNRISKTLKTMRNLTVFPRLSMNGWRNRISEILI